MFRVSVLALLSVGALADCNLNANNNGCENATTVSCVSACGVLQSEESCKTVASCAWTDNGPFSSCELTGDANDDCATRADSLCSGNCSLVTKSCQLTHSCYGPASECYGENSPVQTESQCNAVNKSCSWTPYCQAVSTCEVPTTQTACTGMAGCFWSVVDSNDEGAKGSCSECFDDYTHIYNLYTLSKNLEGKTCVASFFGSNMSVEFFTVVSGTGCTGGKEKLLPYTLECSDDNNNSTGGGNNNTTNNSTGGGNNTNNSTGGGNNNTTNNSTGGNNTNNSTGGGKNTTGGGKNNTSGNNTGDSTVNGAVTLVSGLGIILAVAAALFV